MKRRTKIPGFVMILLLITLVSTAYAKTIFTSEDRAEASFPYSKEDESRYQAIFDAAVSATQEADKKAWDAQAQYNIDFFARLSEEERAAFPGIFTVPDENAISKEAAVYTAYAAMERLFGYTGDVLARFYPVCFFNVKNPDSPVWQIVFEPVDIQILQQYYGFSVIIQADDGLVLKISDSSDAVG